jgi:hypothetical protein
MPRKTSKPKLTVREQKAGSRPRGGYERNAQKPKTRPRGGYLVAGLLSTIRKQGRSS